MRTSTIYTDQEKQPQIGSTKTLSISFKNQGNMEKPAKSTHEIDSLYFNHWMT